MMSCFLCKAKLSKGFANHIVDYNGHIIIVKKVPAIVCSQCGEYYVEHEVTLKLEKIVDEVKLSRAEVTIINYHERAA